MTFLLSEDKALRDKLKGVTVTDQKADGGTGATRAVGVWFGQPDQELRNQSYPYIVIDMVDIGEDTSRSMRGMVKPDYISDPTTTDGTTPYDPDMNDWSMHWPIPVLIDYQVTTYSRQPRHDRQILAELTSSRLPLRFGVLEPDDGTTRRLDVIGVSKRDVTESGKRLFVNVFTVRVSSEITESQLRLAYKVLTVHVEGTIGPGENLDPVDSFTLPE